MSKLYSVPTGFNAFTAATNLVQLTAGTSRGIKIHAICIGQSTEAGDAEAEQLQITLLRHVGGFTPGSGTAVTIQPYNIDNLPTADASASRNATNASGGTTNTLWNDGWNVQIPYLFLPTPAMQCDIAATDALAVRVSAPADSITAACTVIFEEF